MKVNETFFSTSAPGTPFTVTIPATTAGNTLVVTYQGQVNSVAGCGATWAFNSHDPQFIVGTNCSAGGTTLTFTAATGFGAYKINVSEWSGMPATVAEDGGGTQNASRPNNNTPTVTPTAGKSVLIIGRAGADPGHITAGPTNGFTSLNFGGSTGFVAAYLLVSSASGSYSTGWTDFSGYGTCPTGIIALDNTSGGSAAPQLTGIMPGNTDGKTRAFIF